MDKEELFKLLSESLDIKVEASRDYNSDATVLKVSILFDGKEVARSEEWI